jgi:hypothetical protein
MTATMNNLWAEWSERAAQELKAEPTANSALPDSHNPAVPDEAAAWEAWARREHAGLMSAAADG